MRDLASCFGEYAIQVSNHPCVSPNLIPSVQNSVACIYRVFLSTQKQILITATWSQGLSLSFGDKPTTAFKLSTSSRLFRKKRGTKSFEFDNYNFDVFWDLSAAKYTAGPEPVACYYVLVMADSELAISLGDMAEEAAAKRLKTGARASKFSLLSRRELFSGHALCLTKAQFSDSGPAHDILIRCSGENEGLKHPVLSVCIDKKTVICVKRLQWNFRGNQTIFVDGLLVDLMWDVHDWFFNPVAGYAVFMFRTRSGSDSRLWLEEKVAQKELEKQEFSLLICACKSP
ncbi:uncharacterized protein LOC127813486 [Diospyros lotus]|uniref:uncharacterized protein LOC127813486 n=1 Tax=Diospyros lotus TaxID=55363 RepID=UPI00225462DE|nr:uncharacterized protein LOC127813486 [Diospyros lotus]